MLNIPGYTLLTYMPEYLTGPRRLSAGTALLVTIACMAVMLLVINPVGRRSDRIGRKPLWYVSAIGFLVLSLPRSS